MAALIGLSPLINPKIPKLYAAAQPHMRGQLYIMLGAPKTGKTLLANEIKRRLPSMVVFDEIALPSAPSTTTALDELLAGGSDVLAVHAVLPGPIVYSQMPICGMAHWVFRVHRVEHSHGLHWDCETIADRHGLYKAKFAFYNHSAHFFVDPVKTDWWEGVEKPAWKTA